MRQSSLSKAGLALILCIGLGVTAGVSAHCATRRGRHVPTPPGSYLQYRVYTVDQLIQQVQDNAVVRRRFARHFHIPEDRVVSYMRANLVESYIPRTGRYTVYCVRRSGRFYPIHQNFRQGTKVFALRNGQPVLKWLCGNPLSKFLPAVATRTTVKKVPVVKVSPTIQTLTPTEAVEFLIPNDTPVLQPMVPLVGSSVAAASVPVLSGGGGGSLLPFLLPLGLFGLHSGGGSASSVILTPPEAVPEAGTWVYLAAAAPLFGLGIRRRARRRSEQG